MFSGSGTLSLTSSKAPSAAADSWTNPFKSGSANGAAAPDKIAARRESFKATSCAYSKLQKVEKA
jgi:cytochrome c556